MERAAADHGQSVADFVEGIVLRALANAGLLEQPSRTRSPTETARLDV